MSLRDYLRAANLVEGAVWKDADIPVIKSSDSCNQLITLGRCEPRCRAEEMMGHMRTAGRLSWWRQEFVFRAAEKLPANGGFKRQRLLAGVMGCKCSWLVLYMGLATPTVTSFLVSQLLPPFPVFLLPSWLCQPLRCCWWEALPGQTVGIDWCGLWCSLELMTFFF